MCLEFLFILLVWRFPAAQDGSYTPKHIDGQSWRRLDCFGWVPGQEWPLQRSVCASCPQLMLRTPVKSPPAAFLTVKGRTNLKIKEKYLSPTGSSSKGLTVSRSNSSLSLYSSASAPTSPMTRKVRQNYQHPGFSSLAWKLVKNG